MLEYILLGVAVGLCITVECIYRYRSYYPETI
jgi:hypothetical protein